MSSPITNPLSFSEQVFPFLCDTLFGTITRDLIPLISAYWKAQKIGDRPTLKATYSFKSSFGCMGTANGEFKYPRGIALDREGHIWVADTDNNRLQCFSPDGTFLKTFGAQEVSARYRLDRPFALKFDSQWNFYICDSGNHRIVVWNPEAEFKFAFGQRGKDDGELDTPNDLTFDHEGNLLVTDDNHRVSIFSPEGIFLRKFGNRFDTEGGPEIYYPIGIVVDDNGDIIVAENLNHRIQRISADGRTSIEKLGPHQGKPEGCFESPWGLALDKTGALVVIEEGNDRIQIIGRREEGEPPKFFVFESEPDESKFCQPKAVAIDWNGDLIITDSENNRIVRWG